MDIGLIYEIAESFFYQTVHQTSFYLYNFFLPPVIFFSIFFYLLAITGVLSRKKKKRFNSNNIEWPFVTIQIPTFNEPVALRCAKHCLNFDYPDDKFEIIIGDDSNSSKVSKLIDDFAREHRDKVKVKRRGLNIGFKAGNLNHMLKFSNGEIIVIFDSDYTPSRKSLKKIVRPFVDDEKIGCVQTRWNFPNKNQNKISRFGYGILMVYQRLIAPINERFGVSLLFGSGEAVRKDLILSLGGWQEGSLTEDVEFSVRVLKLGYKIVYLDDVKVSGETPYTLKGLRTQQKRWAYGNLRAFIDHVNSLLFGDFSFMQKVMLIFTLLGYLSSFFFVPYVISSLIFFASTPPAPVDWYKFSVQTSKFLIATSGFLIAMVIALSKERRLDMLPSVLSSSVTVGFLTAISVCSGFINALIGKKMQWKIISKKGNRSFKLEKDTNVSEGK
jgi:cellulose synthase/poly-beta-1,6-N-acetylglucosamine synthase-like glycosyltransferase